MHKLFEALKERRVFRVVIAYAVVAWGAVQIVLTVSPEFGLPDWLGRATIFLALAGFPVALGLSWAFDLSATGVRRGRIALAGAAVAMAIALGIGLTRFPAEGRLSEDDAQALIAEAEVLAAAERYLEAYGLAARAEMVLPRDPVLASLMAEVTEEVDFVSEPPGARVFVVAWRPDGGDLDSESRLLGETPLTAVRLPRALHFVRFELEGHRTEERPLSLVDVGLLAGPGVEPDAAPGLSLSLEEAGRTDSRQVRVPGGPYSIASADLPLGLSATLDEFLIDRFEVTNAEYAEFVLEGGYADRRFWERDFETGDSVLSFDDAMARFVDRTGLPGPRFWSGQAYPQGKADHPVAGVSWYEAAAYAVFRRRQLPTAYQWEKAGRNGSTASGDAIAMPWGISLGGFDRTLANFRGSGTDPVDAHPFGISPYGVYAMAGNVSEWLLNPAGEGRAVTGGSWESPAYLFSEFSGLDPFFASESLGFRLVELESGRRRLGTDQGDGPLGGDPIVPQYVPVDEATARTFLSHYEYDPVELDPLTHESVDEGRWIRETVSFLGPYGDRLTGYLYLPKSVPPPYQTLLYVPSGFTLGWTNVPEDTEWVMGPVIQSGRAVFSVVLSGMAGNSWAEGWTPPEPISVRFRNELVRNAVEIRTGIDYLASRTDIDMERFGYASFSFGVGSRGAFLSADDRFRLAVMMGAGIDERVRPVRPEVDPVNFAPYLDIPLLIVQGRHDEEHPYFTRFLPLLNLLPEEYTTLVLVDGAGHLVRPESRVPPITRFLTEHFGPVAR
ncbi:MAG: SUMF1/EgtB/PvdO family nonheme iron enzyme [Gemmatimonadetes bacterium]|nr:SUMF1/EgtB/PvdO family nonheme iron enzyme [Gemmatimonadota bacterium]